MESHFGLFLLPLQTSFSCQNKIVPKVALTLSPGFFPFIFALYPIIFFKTCTPIFSSAWNLTEIFFSQPKVEIKRSAAFFFHDKSTKKKIFQRFQRQKTAMLFFGTTIRSPQKLDYLTTLDQHFTGCVKTKKKKFQRNF